MPLVCIRDEMALQLQTEWHTANVMRHSVSHSLEFLTHPAATLHALSLPLWALQTERRQCILEILQQGCCKQKCGGK